MRFTPACAVEDFLIKWDVKGCETVTEWQEDRRKEITVRMLLSLSVGLPPSQEAQQGRQTKDKYEYAIGLKCKHGDKQTLTWWLGGSDSAEGDAGGGVAKDPQGNVQKRASKWMLSGKGRK